MCLRAAVWKCTAQMSQELKSYTNKQDTERLLWAELISNYFSSIYAEVLFQQIFSEMIIFQLAYDFKRFATFTGIKWQSEFFFFFCRRYNLFYSRCFENQLHGAWGKLLGIMVSGVKPASMLRWKSTLLHFQSAFLLIHQEQRKRVRKRIQVLESLPPHGKSG